jgi:hypothetical protein
MLREKCGAQSLEDARLFVARGQTPTSSGLERPGSTGTLPCQTEREFWREVPSTSPKGGSG